MFSRTAEGFLEDVSPSPQKAFSGLNSLEAEVEIGVLSDCKHVNDLDGHLRDHLHSPAEHGDPTLETKKEETVENEKRAVPQRARRGQCSAEEGHRRPKPAFFFLHKNYFFSFCLLEKRTYNFDFIYKSLQK